MDSSYKQVISSNFHPLLEAQSGNPSKELGKYFLILGTPIGKPRMTQRDRWKQRPIVLKYYEKKDQLIETVGEIQSQRLRLIFLFEPPKSWSRKRREAALQNPKTTRPDVDNLVKAVLDSLYKEDSVVYEIQAIKLWWSYSATIIQEIQ